MPKGIYKRVKPIWNKGKKGVQVAWNKGIHMWAIKENPRGMLGKHLSEESRKKISLAHTGLKRTEETKRRLSLAKMGDKNPMKRLDVRKKAGLSHLGQIPWNKGLSKDEYSKHFPNGFGGKGRLFGYKHTLASRLKMSQNTIGKKHNVIWTSKRLKESSDRMKKNRQNLNFNKKMFASLQRSVTKPHKKVQFFIKNNTKLKTETNYAFKVGLSFGSIDEADIEKKIAIFIDGNYWHNYPKLRKWDKCCNTTLKNQGWKVLRFWESEIKNHPEKIINRLKRAEYLRS